jgi:hypothetical protein
MAGTAGPRVVLTYSQQAPICVKPLAAVVIVLTLMACGGNASQPSPVACSAPMVEVNNPYDFAVDVSYQPSRYSDRRQLGTVDPHMVVRLGPIERLPPITVTGNDYNDRFISGGSPSFYFTYRMTGRTDLLTASEVRTRLVCP